MATVFRLYRFGWKVLRALWLCIAGTLIPSPLTEAQEVGEVFQDCDVCPEMVVIPAGSFMMGSPDTEKGRDRDEGPQHEVTINYAFAVGVYEVTFDEWDACVQGGGCGGHEPSDWGWGRGKQPVVDVHWENAWQYVDWLTDQTGEEYRLLSEAEWEYLARAGTRTAWQWGETEREQCRYANGWDASALSETGVPWEAVGCRDRQAFTAPVGSYRPNGFGLFDMLGNVSEWVDDCENRGYEGAPTDGGPRYSGNCSRRVIRGGNWGDPPSELRSASRGDRSADFRNGDLGFRIARSLR